MKRMKHSMKKLSFVAPLTATGLLLIAVQALAMHPNHPLGFSPERAYQVGLQDQVDLYSGTVSMTLPIGPFTLVYNSNVWLYDEVSEGVYETRPDYERNAGIGWKLGWGEVYSPSHAYNPSGQRWTFVDQAGGRHEFWPVLHDGEDDGDNTVFYTRDNSYLRMRKVDDYVVEIEFPDGTTRRYRAPTSGGGTTHRLEKAWSRFASVEDPDLTVEYNLDYTLWTVTDRYERTHYVHLTEQYHNISPVVTDIDIESIGGQRAFYSFYYDEIEVQRSCKDNSPNTSGWILAPHLRRIDLPDGTSYKMKIDGELKYYNSCSEGPDDIPGVLKEIQFPTGGRMAWTYQEYDFPGTTSDDPFDTTAGVQYKATKHRDGTEEGVWRYKSTPVPYDEINDRDPEMITEVVHPTGDCTKHYFNARYWITPSEWRGWERALPFSYRDEIDGRYLSSEVWTSNNGAGSCSGTKLRSKYLRFTFDGSPGGNNEAEWLQSNRRVQAFRTVFHDDGNRWTETSMAEFDGLGHYRQAASTGNFWSGSTTNEQRVVKTNYNRVTGTYGQAGYTPPAVTDPWVLNVFDFVERTEWDAVGEATSRVEYTFDMDTGFLDCKRILESGTTRSADDILIRNFHDSLGLLTEVKRYGGDLQSLGTGSSCPGNLGQPEYWVKHTYENGVRKTTRPYQPDGTAGPFLTYDVDLDLSTGLVIRSRDPAGFGVSYSYDVARRLTQITPDDGASLTYAYVNPTSTTDAVVQMDAVVGTTTLASSELVFDEFGRTTQQRRKMPDGTWSTWEILYNARGWTTSISEPGDPTKTTQFLQFDPFSRATVIRPPDGQTHDLLFSYQGIREVVSQAKINLTGGETYVSTTHRYDAHGRLRRAIEPSGDNGSNVTTNYFYDVGKRLTQIDSGGLQTRMFDYDNRGFLLSETHPEKGATGGGTVFNYDFDSRGLVHRNLDGPNDLSFTYDFMGRLTEVRDLNQGSRLVTDLVYDSGLGFGTGKLAKATQHNWMDLPWNVTGIEDVKVIETYEYQGKGGAISRRHTKTTLDLASTQSGETQPFDLFYAYDDLGNVSQITYPSCKSYFCGLQVAPGRTVDYTYSEGLLDQVVGWTGSIAYHANGAFSTIPHGNGVTDHQVLEPNVTSRPERIYTSGVTNAQGQTANFGTGLYTYDGAGNIISKGNDTFVYDEVSRLVDATVRGWRETYQYDAFGNIKEVETTPPGGSPSTVMFSVDASSNRISGAVAYDAAGNMTVWGTNGYTWDATNQLQEMNSRFYYLYTASGERITTIDWQGSLSTREITFSLRGLNNQVLSRFVLLGDQASGGDWSRDRDYIYAGGRLLASDDETASGERHYHLDHLGTPRLITDGSGVVFAWQRYLPYGEELNGSGQEVMKYTGHERDLETGHDYMHARYYHEHLGRFLSVDPVRSKSPQAMNRYAYVGGNPINWTDPRGLLTCPPGIDDCSTIVIDTPLDPVDEDGPPTESLPYSCHNRYGGFGCGYNPEGELGADERKEGRKKKKCYESGGSWVNGQCVPGSGNDGDRDPPDPDPIVVQPPPPPPPPPERCTGAKDRDCWVLLDTWTRDFWPPVWLYGDRRCTCYWYYKGPDGGALYHFEDTKNVPSAGRIIQDGQCFCSPPSG